MTPTFFLLASAVAVGALAQRSTGIGFSLVVTPVCAVALLPDDTIGTAVRLALIADVAVLVSERQAIDWPSVRRLLCPALLAVPGGLAVATVVSSRALLVVASVGTAMASVHLLRVLTRTANEGDGGGGGALLPPTGRMPSGRTSSGRTSSGRTASGRPSSGATRAAGFAAGFLGVTTGMSGPPLALHASTTGRSLAHGRASMVVLFTVVDLVATAAHPRSLPLGEIALLGLAIVAGLNGGAWVAGRVADHHLRAAVLGLVVTSTVLGLVRVLS